MALQGVRSSGSELVGGTFRSGSIPTGPPTVRILAANPTREVSGQTFRDPVQPLIFLWDRPVDGFERGDIDVRWYDLDGKTGTLSDFPPVNGVASFQTNLNFPQDAEGHVDVTVKENSAADSTDDTKIGPQEPVTVSLEYNTHVPIETYPEVTIDDPPQDPFRGKNLTLVIRWNEIVSGFTLRDDVTVEVNGVEMNAIITNLRVTTDPKVWNADVALPDNTQGILRIRIAADSVQGTQNLGPRSEYVKTINFVNLDDIDTTIIGSTTICEKIYTYAQKKGACVGILDLIVNDGFAYLITQIVHSSGVTEEQPVDVLLWHLRGKAELIRFNLTTCEDVVLEEYPDVLTAPRSFYLFDGKVRFFRGSHHAYEFPAEIYGDFEVILDDGSSETRKHIEIPGYLTLGEELPDWRGEIGGLYEINGTDINLIGGIGQSVESNPDALPDDPYNPYYGIHGGMASPIIVSGKDVYAIAGYGKLSEIGKNDVSNSEADRIENWNFGRITDTLDQRLAFLETNDRTGWEVIQDLARVTRSRIGFKGDVFFWEPQKPLTAFLDTTITETSDELTFNSPTRQEIPTEGFIKIGGEIIKFGNRVDDDIAQILRGYYGGVPEEHLSESQIVFFQHFITEYISLTPSTDEDTLYNVVTVNYGDSKSVSKVNPVSLNQYPRRELEVSLPLSNQQTAWAEFIAQDYVNDFSGAKTVINCEIELDENIEVGNVCVVRQRGRAHLNDIAGIVVQVGHQIIRKITTLRLLTISPSIPQTTVGPSDPVPPPVSLDSPVLVFDSQTVNSITVSWVAIAGATKYLAQIRKTGETSWPAEVEVTSPHTFTGLEDNTSYDIRIKASDGTNESAFSETGNVMTDPVLIVAVQDDNHGIGLFDISRNGGVIARLREFRAQRGRRESFDNIASLGSDQVVIWDGGEDDLQVYNVSTPIPGSQQLSPVRQYTGIPNNINAVRGLEVDGNFIVCAERYLQGGNPRSRIVYFDSRGSGIWNAQRSPYVMPTTNVVNGITKLTGIVVSGWPGWAVVSGRDLITFGMNGSSDPAFPPPVGKTLSFPTHDLTTGVSIPVPTGITYLGNNKIATVHFQDNIIRVWDIRGNDGTTMAIEKQFPISDSTIGTGRTRHAWNRMDGITLLK